MKMSREEAAKYFVVAWVKGWSLRTYLNTIGGGFKTIGWGDAHAAYPWLTADAGMFMRNMSVRRYIADAFRVLNDKLWDAPDDAARLLLSKRIESLNGANAKVHDDEAAKDLRKTNNQYRNTLSAVKLSVDCMRRGNGHAWNVVK